MSRVLPVLFNTEMVKAILDGRKTVTRRIVKPQPKKDQIHKLGVCIAGDKKDIGKFMFGTHEYGGNILHVKIPYQTGDILYVRETWSEHYTANSDGKLVYCYKADGINLKAECLPGETNRWYPSIHMPKEAARIWLGVAEVRVERLQDMTLNDYLKEGVCLPPEAFNDPDNAYCQAKELFSNIWDSTIEKTDIALYGWDANPWVWVIEFEQCKKPRCTTCTIK